MAKMTTGKPQVQGELKPGRQVVKCNKIVMKRSDEGKPYIRYWLQAVGTMCTSRCMLSLDVSKPAVANRWNGWLAATGMPYGTEFDPEDPHDLAKYLLGRCFVGVISCEKNGRYTNVDVANYAEKISPQEEALIAEHEAPWTEGDPIPEFEPNKPRRGQQGQGAPQGNPYEPQGGYDEYDNYDPAQDGFNGGF